MKEEKAKKAEKIIREIEYDREVIEKINKFLSIGRHDFEIVITNKSKPYKGLTLFDFELDHMRLAFRLCSFLRREYERDLRKKEKELAKL